MWRRACRYAWPMKELRRIPEATVARLPLYLRALSEDVDRRPGATISSEVLANQAGVNAAQVRKDLSHLGNYGVRGVGYEVAYLVTQIRRELGLDVDRRVAIVGVGNLGRALANYGGFPERRFRIVAAFDSDPSKVGEVLGEAVVRRAEELVDVVKAEGVAIGVITTPARYAQDVTDRLVSGGVTSILNFAPTVLTVPKGVSLRQVDLGVELQILSFYEQHAENQRELDERISLEDGALENGDPPGFVDPSLANPLIANPDLVADPDLVDGALLDDELDGRALGDTATAIGSTAIGSTAIGSTAIEGRAPGDMAEPSAPAAGRG
jgi:redox-sensing transcriptional repressor